jgi:rod shape-determining protein MreC
MVIQQRELRTRTRLAILAVTAVLLISIDNGHSGLIQSLRSAAHGLLAPVQSLANDAFRPLRDVGGVTASGSLRSQNAQLRRQIAAMRRQLKKTHGATSQVGQLEKLLDLPTVENAAGVIARVTSGPAENFERTVELDTGSNKGIKVGYPVLTGDGLIGTVSEVSSHQATVTLIDNPSVGVGVRFEVSQLFGVTLAHAGSTDLTITGLSDNVTKPSKGELVFTSAVSNSIFPPDVAVGIVSSYRKQPPNPTPVITVTPIVNLDRLGYVKVLRYPS